MTKLLEVKDLNTHYKMNGTWIKAVNTVSINIDQGDSIGIVGESGCGKSTLALSILRVLPDNAKIQGGEILFEGKDIIQMPEEVVQREIRWKKISMIFQGALNSLDPVKRVGDLLVEILKDKEEDIKINEAKERIKTRFEILGLEPIVMRVYPHELSGGMKQRVVIAMSLLCEPPIIIADEPTTALDVVTQDQVMDEIDRLRRESNIALILISHNISIMTEMCDQIVVMYGGRVYESAKVTTLFKNPANPYTSGLLHSLPSVEGDLRELKGIPGEPVNLLDPPSGCFFHPRCHFTKDICKTTEPPLREVEDGHLSYCHFELDLEGR